MLLKGNIQKLSWLYLFLFLAPLVLLVNAQIIQQDLMYPEQPMVYLVNQNIHSWSDLLAIYLHPRMLDPVNVSFFRPSGHFLIYQMMAPLIGWHNTRALLAVNFIFLALAGVVLIKIYELLFPSFKTGGYIAFAICLMHPLFLIVRITIMHYEFASLFFLLESLYCFMVFCQKNLAGQSVPVNQIKFKNFNWLVFTILFYCVAATFKEVTIMLMPALLVYLYLALYAKQASRNFFKIFISKEVIQLSVLLVAVGAMTTLYLSLAWSNAEHPLFIPYDSHSIRNVLNKFLKIIFSFPYNFIPGSGVRSSAGLWEIEMFPWVTSVLMLSVMFIVPFHTWRVFSSKSNTRNYKTQFLFLYSCVALFLLFPILWNHAMPWHAGLSLVFLSLMAGHAFECFFQRVFATPFSRKIVALGFALIISLSTLEVNQINYEYLFKHPVLFNYIINRNAVTNPPRLAGLNNDSVIVVEDRLIPYRDYLRGDSFYPYLFLGEADPQRLVKAEGAYAYRYVYGGTLFRWAYSNIKLREQVYPFRIENMANIPDEEIIYNWLQHYNNIYCLSFDKAGQWHDRTLEFKRNLLKESLRRHMNINPYQALSATALTGQRLLYTRIVLPDSMVCKQFCDSDKRCKAFTYLNVKKHSQFLTACQFYQALDGKHRPCQACTSFVKEKA